MNYSSGQGKKEKVFNVVNSFLFNDRKEIALNSLTNQAGATAEQNLNIKKRANKILGFG